MPAPPQAPAPALWRRTALLADALKAIIWPPVTLAQIAAICARKCRQLFERPRRRELQTIPVLP
jgi:hypothetical protein